MGIFDDLEGAASSLLKSGKKALKPVAGAALMAGSPGLAGLKASADLLGWDNTLNYVVPTLMGAGVGALIGGPPGAAVGAATALGSTIAGPPAGRAVSKATGVDELGTAAEFGVYGVGGGLGLGGLGAGAARTAGKVGMDRVLAHLALKSSLEMGALSGLGAAGGQGGAKAIGLPEEFGILAGGVGGPVLLPTAFRSVRGRMFNADNPAMKNLAETFGANEANSLRKNRVVDMRKSWVTTEAHQDMLRSVDRNIATHDINISRYTPEQTDEYYRAFTGGYSRAELVAGERGVMLPEIKEITTDAFNKAKARLRTRVKSREVSLATLNEMEAKYGDIAAELPPGAALEPNPAYQKQTGRDADSKSWFYKDEQGVEHLIPDADVPLYQSGEKQTWWFTGDDGTKRLVPNEVATARMQLDNAQRLMADADSRLGKLLGVDDPSGIAMDPDELQNLLRDKYMPDYKTKLTEAQQRFMDMPRQEKTALRMAADAEAAKYKADTMVKFENARRAKAELLAFRDFVSKHPELGAVPRQQVAEAARAYAAVAQQTAMAKKWGTSGYMAAREPMEAFEDYWKAAHFVATPHAPENREMIKRGFLDSPRGQFFETDGVVVKPIKVLDLDERRKLASVRALNENDEAARDLPWDKIAVRYQVDPPHEQVLADALGLKVPEIPEDAASQAKLLDRAVANGTLTPAQAERLKNPGPRVDQVRARNEDLSRARKDLFREFKGRVAHDRIQAEFSQFKQVFPRHDEKIDAEKMASDLETARTDFMKFFMPTGTSIEGKYLTPEHERINVQGFKNLLMRGFRMNAAKKTIDQDAQSLEWFTRTFQDRLGDYLAVDDIGILDTFQAAPDDSPMKSIIMMMGRTPDDYLRLMNNNGDVHLPGAAGQLQRRLAVGESVTSAPMKALLYDHFGAIESHAATAGAFWQPVFNMLDEIGAEKLGIPRGAGPQLRRAGKALLDQGVHPGRALKAAASELHPLSKQGSMAKYAETIVDWTKVDKDLSRGLKMLEKEFPEHADMVKQWLLSQTDDFVLDAKNAAMFPGLRDDARIRAAAQNLAFLRQELLNGGALHGLAPNTKARAWMMKVDPELRPWVDRDVIRQGSGNERIKMIFDDGGTATSVDLALEVLRGMKKAGINKPLAEVLVWGREADMATPVSLMQSMAIKETMGKVARMANRPVTPDDLVFRGGTWEINSRNKWPAEIARDLQGFNDIIAGKHKWAGLQKMSQQVAYGNLAADLSLLGIQGYKYLAQSLLSGNGLDAVKNFAGVAKIPATKVGGQTVGLTGNVVRKQLNDVSTHIMSDYGFYAWVRSNLDEIQYYSQLGLTGGMKGYVAGPDVRKLPLESLPVIGKSFIGKGFAGIRMGTDLQFNRQLYYWKVQGIRENLEVAKTLRLLGRDFTQHYYESANDNFKVTVDELGGLDGYLLGEHEDIVKATVRQVNRSMGGVSMDAEGIGVNRQALEQILLIVPGFFRAQVGQWASIVTKPHTMEGQLAMTMLAREYLFAAGVVTGLSRLMGTNDQVNYEDITKPTWLGLPLPDGNTVNILPTMSLPRLASRVLNNSVNAVEGEESFDPTIALESMARGRMSPLLSTAYDNMSGEDFLGRKYDSEREKWGMTMANLVLPIIGSSFAEDVKEQQKHAGAGLGFNWMDIAETTGFNLIGKSMVPQHPKERLDKAANGVFGTDWSLLTDAEKREMRQNPAVLAMEAEWDFYSMRRAGTQEQRVDSAYQGYEQYIKEIWEQPRSIGNFKSTQIDDDEMVAAGQMPGDVWRERYHARQQAAAERFKFLEDELTRAGIDPDQIRADKMQKLREGRDPGSIAWLVQAAKTEYAGVEPRTVERRLATPSGEVTVEVTDWDQFQQDREAVIARYPAVVAERVRREDSSQTPGIASYREAADAQKAIESIPRYRGLSTEQGDQLDQMQAVMTKLAEKVKGQMGLPPGTAVPGLAPGIRRAAVAQMQQLGIVRNEADLQLAALAIMMQENPKLADTLRNPEQIVAVLQNPEAVIFYPYLRYRVPKQLWPRLPAQVFDAPLVQAELAAAGG